MGHPAEPCIKEMETTQVHKVHVLLAFTIVQKTPMSTCDSALSAVFVMPKSSLLKTPNSSYIEPVTRHWATNGLFNNTLSSDITTQAAGLRLSAVWTGPNVSLQDQKMASNESKL